MSTTKIFANRDSATAILRKLGVAKSEYCKYIIKQGDQFILDLGAAQNSLLAKEAEKDLKPEIKPQVKTQPKKVAIDENLIIRSKIGRATDKIKPRSKIEVKGDKIRTVSTVCRNLVLSGKSNAEVWALIKSEFDLSDTKKHYPSWYRSELKRSGKLK